MSATTTMFTDAQWDEWAKERNREFKEKHGRDMTAEDVIATWGGRSVGRSQDTGRRSATSGSADNGIIDQT